MNRTYLKLNQDPRGWQPNESDEWMATIGKKEEEEEEWNDGPSATSKSKKSLPPDYQFIEALINRP